jgi:hypothetical protein
MLTIVVQPPARAQLNVALFPPLACRLSSKTDIFEELSDLWTTVELFDSSGEAVSDLLKGKTTDSAHPLNATHSEYHAYFYFPDLVISEPGRYYIRIGLMKMEYSEDTSAKAVVLEFVQSYLIIVQDTPVPSSSLSK